MKPITSMSLRVTGVVGGGGFSSRRLDLSKRVRRGKLGIRDREERREPRGHRKRARARATLDGYQACRGREPLGRVLPQGANFPGTGPPTRITAPGTGDMFRQPERHGRGLGGTGRIIAGYRKRPFLSGDRMASPAPSRARRRQWPDALSRGFGGKGKPKKPSVRGFVLGHFICCRYPSYHGTGSGPRSADS